MTDIGSLPVLCYASHSSSTQSNGHQCHCFGSVVKATGGARVNGSRAGSKRSQRTPHFEEGGPSSTLTDRLLTVTDLCRLLGMSRRWVHERTRRQEIPCYRFGTALRFDLEDVRRWMADFYATKPTPGGGETWES